MFKKILIVEDQQIQNLGVRNTLQEMNIQYFDFDYYCDQALLKIKTAFSEGQPYDLLIADLSFDGDSISQRIVSGQELISEVKKIQPEMKAVVFSVEKNPKIINDLYNVYNINGFVSKGRHDGKLLTSTLQKVFNGETVIPQHILNAMRHIPFEFSKYDMKLLDLLSTGYKQNEMENILKQYELKPYSTRSIEKRLSELRDVVGAKTNIEMIVICKDIDII